jgi:hypothetical protein
MWVLWNPILVHLETVLVLVQDRWTVTRLNWKLVLVLLEIV